VSALPVTGIHHLKNSTKDSAMPSVNSLNDLLIEEIKDLYDAEKQLVKALPKMAKAATNPELKQGFTTHLEETKNHVARLEQVFEQLGAPAKGKTCKAMQGLIEEGTEAIELKAPDAIRDACLIGAAQRVEHYEIAAYGTVRTLAETVGETEVVDLLQETLDEEKKTDETLTAVADSVNEEANLVAEEKEQD
jgi:ferritin-like metal-binding protein YciE